MKKASLGLNRKVSRNVGVCPQLFIAAGRN
jgi:hypothetical protein